MTSRNSPSDIQRPEDFDFTTGSAGGRWILFPTILASSMAFIDSTALNVVLPSLQKAFGTTGSDLLWVINAYHLMLAALILTGGAMGDRFGRKKVFMWGILVFMAGSAGCGLSQGTLMLVLFRLLQGLGGALMIPGSLSLISALFSEKEKGKAIGYWSAATTVVTISGPLLGGLLGDLGLWRLIFFINLPLGIAAVAALVKKVPETADPDNQRGTDYTGAVLAFLGLGLLTFGFLEVPEQGGFRYLRVWLPLAAGLVFSLLFLRHERHCPRPMLPLSVFKNRNFAAANLLTLLLYGALGTGMLFLSLNLVQVQGYSQLQAGLSFLPFSVIMFFLSPRTGDYTDRHGPRRLLIAGPLVAGTGFFALGLPGITSGPGVFWTTFFPGILLFGLGMALTVVPLTTTIMSSLKGQWSGLASGTNNAATRTANVTGIAIVGALAIAYYTSNIKTEAQKLPVSQEMVQKLSKQGKNLGEATVPEQFPQAQAKKALAIIKQEFSATFQLVQWACAVMAWLAALVAFLRIDR